MSTHARGSIREMIAIALPMVVSMSCDTAMIFTDRLFLAKLGSEQMNAAMGGGLTAFMIGSFVFGLAGYVSALAAQYLGAGRRERCAVALFQAVLCCGLAYIPVVACRPLGHALFAGMGVSPQQQVYQVQYFDILVYGIIFSWLRNAFGAFFSGTGRTGTVMLASCTALLVNCAATYILVFGKLGFPALGMYGAALGTILGGGSGLLVLLAAYFSRKNRREYQVMSSFRLNREVLGKLLRYGSPTGLELFLNILGFNLLVMIFHAHGPLTATAATVVFNWDMVSFVPLIGVEIGVITLVGRAMGGGDPELAHRHVLAGFKLGLGYSALILVLFLFFPYQLVGIFYPPEPAGSAFASAVPLAVAMIRAASLYVLVEALFVVFVGALRGAGDTLWAMFISVGLHWMMVAVLWWVLRVLGWSPLAGWITVVVLFFIFSGLAYWRYSTGVWRTIRMVEPEDPRMALGDGIHEAPEV